MRRQDAAVAKRVLIKNSRATQLDVLDCVHDQPVGEAVGGPVNIVVPLAVTYLTYVVLAAVFVYALFSHALQVDERAATVDLDRELQELVSRLGAASL